MMRQYGRQKNKAKTSTDFGLDVSRLAMNTWQQEADWIELALVAVAVATMLSF